MAEREPQPPVIQVQLPAITVNYQDVTKFAGDKVRLKTDVKAAKIRQVVVPTTGHSEDTQSDTSQPDSIATYVFKESEEEKIEKSSQNTEPTTPSSSSDVTGQIASMNLSDGMMNFIAFENLRHLMENNKFLEAVDLIEEFLPSPCQQLMMSECYFQLGRERNALRCVEALQTMMTSSPRPMVGDVTKLVDIYISDSSYIRALILLSCCAKLYKIDSNPIISVVGIMHCSFNCYHVIKALAQEGDRMKGIATDVGLEMITDMLKELRSVSGADKDDKVNMEADCLNYVGASYGAVGKSEKAIEFYNEAVDLMKKTFGSEATKYNLVGDLLSNIGTAHDYLGNYPMAESFYLQSLDVYEKAEDWSSYEVKHENIKMSNINLRNTREKYKK
uniref:uncharacterized protein LOC120332184 n=1 Tax=Styela clava TaxID=7725 RepID=UPI00193A4D2A|nr:uncharacterized protein LOC120332184 [Styela clava]